MMICQERAINETKRERELCAKRLCRTRSERKFSFWQRMGEIYAMQLIMKAMKANRRIIFSSKLSTQRSNGVENDLTAAIKKDFIVMFLESLNCLSDYTPLIIFI